MQLRVRDLRARIESLQVGALEAAGRGVQFRECRFAELQLPPGGAEAKRASAAAAAAATAAAASASRASDAADLVAGAGADQEAAAAPAAAAPAGEDGLLRPLNAGQSAALERLLTAVRAPVGSADAAQVLMLLHGGPGTGKTWLCAAMSEGLNEHCVPHAACAFMWSAVMQMDVNCTKVSAHRMAGMGVTELTPKVVQAKNFDGQEMRLGKLLDDQGGTAKPQVLFIDEVSMLSSMMWVMLDRTFRAYHKCPSLPFGGMHVVVIGDFFQIAPTGGIHVMAELVERQHGEARVLEGAKNDAAEVFSRFERWELEVQERASADRAHCELLAAMRGAALPGGCRHPFTKAVLKSLLKRQLSPDLLRADPAFEEAAVVAATNDERAVISKRMIVRWAKMHGQPVFRWVLRWHAAADKGGSASEGGAPQRPDAVMQALLPHMPSLEVYWARGMPMVLSEHAENKGPRAVRAEYMCFKGARGYADSVFPAPQANAPLHDDEGEQAEGSPCGECWCDDDGEPLPWAAGRVFTIPQPEDLYVRVVPKTGGADPFVLPVRSRASRDVFTGHKWADFKKILPDGAVVGKSWPSVHAHGATQGFVFTFEKLQGVTVDRLIILLNDRHGASVPNVTLEKLWVALTRVREGKHVAIWPAEAAELEYLLRLEWPAALRAWHRNYAAQEPQSGSAAIGDAWRTGRLVLEGTFPPKALSTRAKQGLESLTAPQLKSIAKKLHVLVPAGRGSSKDQLVELLRPWCEVARQVL
jgi:hypothetical protein